jgi:hypothetical protein
MSHVVIGFANSGSIEVFPVEVISPILIVSMTPGDSDMIAPVRIAFVEISPVVVVPLSVEICSVDPVFFARAASSQISGATISTTGSVEPVRYSSHEAAVTSDIESVLMVKNGNSTSAMSRVQLILNEKDRIVKYVTKIILEIISRNHIESSLWSISSVQIF